jgi:hypothetical protein
LRGRWAGTMARPICLRPSGGLPRPCHCMSLSWAGSPPHDTCYFLSLPVASPHRDCTSQRGWLSPLVLATLPPSASCFPSPLGPRPESVIGSSSHHHRAEGLGASHRQGVSSYRQAEGPGGAPTRHVLWAERGPQSRPGYLLCRKGFPMIEVPSPKDRVGY